MQYEQYEQHEQHTQCRFIKWKDLCSILEVVTPAFPQDIFPDVCPDSTDSAPRDIIHNEQKDGKAIFLLSSDTGLTMIVEDVKQ